MSGKAFSFSFKKKNTGPKVQAVNKRGFEKVEEEQDDIEIITGVDEKGIAGTKPKVVKEDLVIPLIQTNRWDEKVLKQKNGTGKKAGVSDGAAKANAKQFTNDVKDDAAAAIISEANKFLQIQEVKGKKDQGLSIPLLLQNQVPQGFEEEEGPLKVDIRPESSKIEDYDAVPIEQFGLAMLRGMGFKQDEGIGKTKQKIDEIKVAVRPKGLGLGAIPVKKKIEDVKKNAGDDVLQMKIGAYVRVVSGPYDDRYGQVKSINGDMGRLTLKWALGSDGPPQEVMEGFVELVTKKQHDEIGRDISRKTKAAKEHARKKEEEAKQAEIDRKRKREDEDNTRSSKKQSKVDQKAASSKSSKDARWCSKGCIVRYVGDEYQKQRRQKFEVRNVRSRNEIKCRNIETEKDFKFEERDLETVIPKAIGSVVIITDGSLKGCFGVIIDKIKEKERVMVEMLPDKKEVERFSYNSVCQFNATENDPIFSK